MNNIPLLKTNKGIKPIIALLLIWIIYVCLTILAPASDTIHRYALNIVQLNLLRATIFVPYLFVWLAALFAILNFKRYIVLVGDSPEKDGFKKFTNGLWFLLTVVVLPAFISLVASYFPRSSAAARVSALSANYSTIILYLAGFWCLLEASGSLNRAIGNIVRLKKTTQTIAVIFSVVLAAIFAWFIFHNPFRRISTDPFIHPTYYISDILIVLTIILPYFFVWLFGILTLLNIRLLIKNVQGIVYRTAFLSVAYGLTNYYSFIDFYPITISGWPLFWTCRT